MEAEESAIMENPDQAWKFTPGPPNLSASTRHLLETYSHIAPSEVDAHCQSIRLRAFALHQYVCIGTFRFLHLFIGTHSLHESEILPRLLNRAEGQAQVYLDLGCCFGHDVRRLVADGVDSRQCFGSDLRPEFWDLGLELFRDRETLGSKFLEADVFDATSALGELDGKVDIVGSSSFFHLFDYERQKQVAHRVIKLLKPVPGSLLVGRQVFDMQRSARGERESKDESGNDSTEWERAHADRAERKRFWHDSATWENMWREVGEEAGGVKFEVHSHAIKKITEVEVEGRMPVEAEFTVRRL